MDQPVITEYHLCEKAFCQKNEASEAVSIHMELTTKQGREILNIKQVDPTLWDDRASAQCYGRI